MAMMMTTVSLQVLLHFSNLQVRLYDFSFSKYTDRRFYSWRHMPVHCVSHCTGCVGAEHCSYSLTCDNTQKLVVARDQSRMGKNKMMPLVNVYAAKSPVPCDQETQTATAAATLEARDIALTACLPCSDDDGALRDRMAVVVS